MYEGASPLEQVFIPHFPFSFQMPFFSFFLRTTAAIAVARLSHRNSVCPSVCHMGGSVKNVASYYHQIFTVGCLEDSSFRNP